MAEADGSFLVVVQILVYLKVLVGVGDHEAQVVGLHGGKTVLRRISHGGEQLFSHAGGVGGGNDFAHFVYRVLRYVAVDPAICIPFDGAAFVEVHWRIVIDPEDLQRLGIEGAGVTADSFQHDGVFRRDLVQVVPVGQAHLTLFEQILVPALAVHALTDRIRVLRSELLADLDHVLDGFAAADGRLVQNFADHQQVHVGVVETGDDGLAAAVDLFGLPVAQAQDLSVGAHGLDDAVFLQNCLFEMSCVHVNFTVQKCCFTHFFTSRKPFLLPRRYASPSRSKCPWGRWYKGLCPW